MTGEEGLAARAALPRDLTEPVVPTRRHARQGEPMPNIPPSAQPGADASPTHPA